MWAIAIAVAFFAAGILATFLPPAARHGDWLPLHLALAGGATVAIAGVMPFFVAALAAAPPSDARLRSVAVLACAGGAIGVTTGFIAALPVVTTGGGLLFIVGIVLTGVVTVAPLIHALGRNRGIVAQGYGLALVQVGIGASLATLFVAGWSPIVTAWTDTKPAHAWLNLIGFVSLVIATTLLHLFPTIVGARIVVRWTTRWTVWGLAVGTPLVAIGLIMTSDAVAWLGAALIATGALSLAIDAASTWRRRGHWRTDPAWHRFATFTMISAIAWFEVGIVIAIGRLVAFGALPTSWSLDAVVAPFVVGWAGLAVLAAATHLVPAIGPGDPAAHARQRELLGRFSMTRVVAANAGTAGLAIGLPLHIDWLAAGGLLTISALLAITGALIIAAIAVGLLPAIGRTAVGEAGGNSGPGGDSGR